MKKKTYVTEILLDGTTVGHICTSKYPTRKLLYSLCRKQAHNPILSLKVLARAGDPKKAVIAHRGEKSDIYMTRAVHNECKYTLLIRAPRWS